ncbi:type II toxin-antitoxin system VapC family toxin [Kiritimatiellota bacterium B12222]|nr:type II toxin-antitoxin system VapC family toxin [Kiritimatiellota bacterium B12222]
MGLLLDTNILSELRKGKKADQHVRQWAQTIAHTPQYISVLSLGEINKSIGIIHRKDPTQAQMLQEWLNGIEIRYADCLLPVCTQVSKVWGQLQSQRSLPVIDGLLAATAQVHHLSIATRNSIDFKDLGVAVVNPFDPVNPIF